MTSAAGAWDPHVMCRQEPLVTPCAQRLLNIVAVRMPTGARTAAHTDTSPDVPCKVEWVTGGSARHMPHAACTHAYRMMRLEGQTEAWHQPRRLSCDPTTAMKARQTRRWQAILVS